MFSSAATAALEAAIELISLRVNPSVLEFLDVQTVAATEKRRGQRVFTDSDTVARPVLR
jgi:hypothetical protein